VDLHKENVIGIASAIAASTDRIGDEFLQALELPHKAHIEFFTPLAFDRIGVNLEDK
jgi:hypothetical protein